MTQIKAKGLNQFISMILSEDAKAELQMFILRNTMILQATSSD